MTRHGTRLLLLGAPGAGKGTQAELLAKTYGIPHVATGEMFRAAKAAGTPLGQRAARYMSKGELVPDDVTIGLVAERLAQPDAAGGFILDGFPRTAPQAEALDVLLAKLNQPLDAAIHLAVPRNELVRRLTGRRVCPNCLSNYHLLFAPPKVEGICDRCGQALVQRDDDSEATVTQRLRVYDEATRPLLGFYQTKGLLHAVDGTLPVDVVHDEIVAATRGAHEVKAR